MNTPVLRPEIEFALKPCGSYLNSSACGWSHDNQTKQSCAEIWQLYSKYNAFIWFHWLYIVVATKPMRIFTLYSSWDCKKTYSLEKNPVKTQYFSFLLITHASLWTLAPHHLRKTTKSRKIPFGKQKKILFWKKCWDFPPRCARVATFRCFWTADYKGNFTRSA